MHNSALLLVTPRSPLVSQAWLRNHAKAMGDHVVATATYEPAGDSWLAGKPNVELGHRLALGRYGLGKMLRLSANKIPPSSREHSDLDGAIVHTATLYDLLGSRGGPIAGLRAAVYVHGVDITWSPFRRFPIPYKHLGNDVSYRKRLIKYALSNGVVYLANSQFSRDRLIEAGFPPESVRLCYLPIRVAPERAHAFSPIGRLNLVYIGRFVDFKGPVEVVRAVGIARKQGLDVRLTMIGDGGLREDVSEVVAELSLAESVQMLGAIPNADAMSHLQKSDALILHNQVDRQSGQLEAFGYAHAEALALGVPVLTGASGGPVEFLRHEENSLLVEPGDVDDQAQQICRLANDIELHRSLSVGARQSALELFSEDSHRSAVLAAFEGIPA